VGEYVVVVEIDTVVELLTLVVPGVLTHESEVDQELVPGSIVQVDEEPDEVEEPESSTGPSDGVERWVAPFVGSPGP